MGVGLGDAVAILHRYRKRNLDQRRRCPVARRSVRPSPIHLFVLVTDEHFGSPYGDAAVRARGSGLLFEPILLALSELCPGSHRASNRLLRGTVTRLTEAGSESHPPGGQMAGPLPSTRDARRNQASTSRTSVDRSTSSFGTMMLGPPLGLNHFRPTARCSPSRANRAVSRVSAADTRRETGGTAAHERHGLRIQSEVPA